MKSRVLSWPFLAMVLACGGAEHPADEHANGGIVPCDTVELLARTDRPDNVRRELSYLEVDYVGAPGVPTSHVQARLRDGESPVDLARRVGATVRSVEGWHLFVFENVDAAKRGVREILCDPTVAEASISLEHRTIH